MNRLILRTFSILFFIYSSFTWASKIEEEQLLALMRTHLADVLHACQDVAGAFIDVEPLGDSGGSFINSVYLIKTSEQKEYIIKIENPIWKGSKTLNEVAALTFLSRYSNLPVPSVIAFNNDSEHSPFGQEYLIMPKLKGRPLNLVINGLYQDREKYDHLLDQLADIIAELKQFEFPYIGNFLAIPIERAGLQIGGIVDFAGYQIDQPCSTYSAYAQHALTYYIQEMERLVKEESPDKKLYQYYIPILKDLLQKGNFDSLNDAQDRFVFSHQDFVMKNILVDGVTVTGILDWEWSGSALQEIESMTGFDFLLTEDDKACFNEKLAERGLKNFFSVPPKGRQLFYRLIGNVYSLVAFREWREGKLEHTAKFLNQKLEQRKIRRDSQFDWESFILDLTQDLNHCIKQFMEL